VCLDLCPEVFEWNDEGLSQARKDKVTAALEANCQEAIESCPTEAIKES